jgi:hypothetical protein
MSEFKKAGFTDKTLFRVVDNRPARDGRIVWISSDDGTGAPFFSDLVDDSQCYSFESFLEELPRDQDGFYLWEGEAQPVPDDWVVDVRCRGGETGEGPASGWYWPVDGTPIDITAFRVISTGQAAPEWPEPDDEVPLSEEGLVFEMPEYTGGSVSYYRVHIAKPTTIKEPYDAECNDIIEALRMNYAEGNAFKAIWRRCAARQGKAKAGYKDGLYDAEKVVFFGGRMVEQEALERGE